MDCKQLTPIFIVSSSCVSCYVTFWILFAYICWIDYLMCVVVFGLFFFFFFGIFENLDFKARVKFYNLSFRSSLNSLNLQCLLYHFELQNQTFSRCILNVMCGFCSFGIIWVVVMKYLVLNKCWKIIATSSLIMGMLHPTFTSFKFILSFKDFCLLPFDDSITFLIMRIMGFS